MPWEHVDGLTPPNVESTKRGMRYEKKRLVVERQGNSLEVRTFPTFGEVDFVAVQLNNPVRVPVSGVEKVDDLVIVILRKVLGKRREWFGEELDFIARSYENVVTPLIGEVERHTVLLHAVEAPRQKGERPVVKLITVRIDLKYPRFAHVNRIVRRVRHRYRRWRYHTPQRVVTRTPQKPAT